MVSSVTAALEFNVSSLGTEFRVQGPDGYLPVERWSIEAPAQAVPGLDLLQRFIANDEALAAGEVIVVEHSTISQLSARQAELLGLPAVADAVAEIRTSGLITQANFRATLQWRRPTGQPLVGVIRVGTWLRIGDGWRRVPDVLFSVAEAIDALASAAPDDQAARLSAISILRDTLPGAQTEGYAEVPGVLGTITISMADAFSLDLRGEGDGIRLIPVLHRAGADDPIPLLPAEQQEAFGNDQFHRFATARSVYTLARGVFVVVAPPLRRALDEVRRVQAGTAATRRAFLAAPRAFLREALGDETDPTVIEGVFCETQAYSDRVLGLGIWQPRVLPWISLETNDWFGSDGTKRTPEPRGRQQREAGLFIGDRKVALTHDQALALATAVGDAKANGVPSVPFEDDQGEIQVPATEDTLRALESIIQSDRAPSLSDQEAAARRRDAPPPEVLIIAPNEEKVDLEARFVPRPAPADQLPESVETLLKPHQREGLQWLQDSWRSGRPGTLLADDMGLGKTLQALAFLTWIRDGMTSGNIPRAPLLIVAPTGLLENWRAEHHRHLALPGLGECLRAYGAGLRALRNDSDDGRPTLDVEEIRRADWVLTTYETLRDYDRDFGQVRFAVLLFDEAQKIKTPGIRLTDAAKAMNPDFRIALTGTPVENRLADLWCIIDTVHPAYLDDLKTFSARYERNTDIDALRKLKRLLDRPIGGCPALLLRRMKEDQLPDLPPHRVELLEVEMPLPQQTAYTETIEHLKTAGRGGTVLAALQRLRAISLHPEPDMLGTDDEFVAASARLKTAMAKLDEIKDRGERALLFVEDLAIQARVAGLLQRRYRMSSLPLIINGLVPGAMRQARVDAFQQGPDGFDVMILSPKAGGVGLTLTRANHVIHLSRWWNPAVEDQCNGRAVRIGQTRLVTTYLPIAILPEGRRSFDQNLHALLERKRNLMREALCPPAATDTDYQELLNATVGT